MASRVARANSKLAPMHEMDVDTRQQADEVARAVDAILGSALAGVYVFGSAVLGGLREHSDLDVFIVVRRRTTESERQALTRQLLDISGRYPRTGAARPVELTIAVHDDLRPWQYPPRREYQYGEWLRAEYENGGVPQPAFDPDLALLVTMVLQGDTALVGPASAALLDPVPSEDVDRALIAGIPELVSDLGTDTRNVVLTLARIWHTLATGCIEAKDAAAERIMDRLPAEHRPVLSYAVADYRGHEQPAWDDLVPAAGAYADYIVDMIGDGS